MARGKLFLGFGLTLLLGACTTAPDGGPEGGDAERHPIAKADAIGSCEADGADHCGGQSDGNCWCDELCVSFGDCCADKVDVCDGEEPPPIQFCHSDDACDDGQVCDESECLSNCPEGMFCPAVCWGQCVPDEGGADDCLASSQCADGEFCEFESECGEGPVGVCAPTPEVCPEIFAPVCGCDAVTYGNACVAAGAGVSVQSEGPCDDPEPSPETCEGACGGQSAGECWCDDLCESFGDCCEDKDEVCEPEPEPEPEPMNCEEVVEAYEAETAEIRACESDDECGQVLAGTSCGCTRNWVARTDADLGEWNSIRAIAGELECQLGGISTCDCPATDGFACVAGTCSWNYL